MRYTAQTLSLPATVAEMYRVADQYAEQVRRLHLSSLGEIYSFVRSIRYSRDVEAPECRGAEECVKSPALTLLYGGDCDDKAVVAGAALSLLGVPWRIVTVSYNGSAEMVHTYLEVLSAGMWKPFDPTTDGLPLFQEKPYTHKLTWEKL